MSIFLFEDFTEEPEKLAVRSGSTGQNVKISAGGGWISIETGATSGNWRQLETVSKLVTAKLQPSFGFKFICEQGSNQEMFLGLCDGEAGSSSNLIGFYRNDGASPGLWKARLKNAGTTVDADLFNGILGDSSNTNILEVVVSPVQVQFLYNGKVAYVMTTTSQIPQSVLMHFAAWIKTATNAARKLSVDYLYLSAGR